MYCNFRAVILISILVVTFNAFAQVGPDLPCSDCQQEYVKPTPYEGSWFNPEQSGSGFLIEVENDRLLGYYFGYDETGEPIWALFDGQLQDASEEGGLYKVNSTLGKYKGGNCINCDYKPPSEIEEIGDIEIIFNRHAHASYSINGGDVQNIVPLYFGFETIKHFEEETTVPILELEGWWTVFIDGSEDVPDVYSYINYLIHISNGFVTQDDSLWFLSEFFPGGIDIVDAGTIKCDKSELNGMSKVSCYYSIALVQKAFKLDLSNISSDRIYGESENGDTLEMIRVSSDLCISPNQPEDCVNTGVFDYLD
jgi:hypothetical protein